MNWLMVSTNANKCTMQEGSSPNKIWRRSLGACNKACDITRPFTARTVYCPFRISYMLAGFLDPSGLGKRRGVMRCRAVETARCEAEEQMLSKIDVQERQSSLIVQIHSKDARNHTNNGDGKGRGSDEKL